MIDINIECIPTVEYLGGSSTLLLASEEQACSFLDATIYKYAMRHSMRWLSPETIRYRSVLNIDANENVSCSEASELFLEIPREIFYQTLGKMICFGGDFVFIKGVTAKLVGKFDNQNSDGYKEKFKKYIEKMIAQDNDLMMEYDQYEDEYPPIDEFGNINKISWLRDYAMHAETFSKRNDVDIFLNLEWNKARSHFPSPFWGLFDRIYKLEKKSKNAVKAIQLK